MDFNINGKTALVVGSNDGVGLACKEALLAEGVIVVDQDDPDAASAVDIVVAHGQRNPGSAFLDIANSTELNQAWDPVVDAIDIYQGALPSMRSKKWGRLVWVGSAGSRSLDADSDQLDAMATLSMRAAHKVAAAEEGPFNITANTVLFGQDQSNEHIGATVAFLCSEGAGYLTGITITADGGSGSAIY